MKKRTAKAGMRQVRTDPTVDGSKIGRNVKPRRHVKSKVYRRSPVYESVARLEVRVEDMIDKLNRHCARHWVIESGMFLAAVGLLGELVFKHLIK
jgi:hypothetical protein